MRRNLRIFGCGLDYRKGGLPRQARAPVAKEDRRASAPFREKRWTSPREVCLERLEGVAPERDKTLFIAFSAHANDLIGQRSVINVERKGLANAAASAIEHLDEGPIAKGALGGKSPGERPRRRIDKRGYLLNAQGIGKAQGMGGFAYPRRRIARACFVLFIEEAVEGTDRSERSISARRAIALPDLAP